jgi:hypothetical protein
MLSVAPASTEISWARDGRVGRRKVTKRITRSGPGALSNLPGWVGSLAIESTPTGLRARLIGFPPDRIQANRIPRAPFSGNVHRGKPGVRGRIGIQGSNNASYPEGRGLP